MIASAQRPGSSFNVFKPDNKPLLVRGTLGDVFETSSKQGGVKAKRPKKLLSDVPPPAVPPLDSNLNFPTNLGVITSSRSSDSRMGSRFGAYSQASFFSRHNPHPARVRHIKGLNGMPICAVHDQGHFPLPRISIAQPSTRERENFIKNYISSNALGLNSTAFPINTITGLQHYPFKEKAVPRIGLIPITDTWRGELRELCTKAGLIADDVPQPVKLPKSPPPAPARKTSYSSETGRLIPPPSRAVSRASIRSQPNLPSQYDQYAHITSYPDTETLMLEMLCQILQTDSVPSVQQWLVSAGTREKGLVLDMIKTAMNNEEMLLQQQEQQAQMIPETPLPPPSRALTARSDDGVRSNLDRRETYEPLRRSTSAMSSRSSASRRQEKRSPFTSPLPDKPATMRFNKGSASLKKFDPLPKIEEASQPKATEQNLPENVETEERS